MQLGEAITAPNFFVDDLHDEKTCPWCKKDEPAGKKPPLKLPNPETDGEMPQNNAGTLRRKLNRSGDREEKKHNFDLKFIPAGKFEFVKEGEKKHMETYLLSEAETKNFRLQYAPHHLIPGNESLKDNPIVAYLGDNKVIKNYKGDSEVESKIKDGQSANYDVNQAANGVWLPSPYAYSNSNEWPSLDGLEVLVKSNANLGLTTAAFKHAYVAAAIYTSGNRQFHMRHVNYSDEVAKILTRLAEKMTASKFVSACPELNKEGNKSEDNKLVAPIGLPSRLNAISLNLKNLLIGPVWRRPFLADGNLMEEYIKDKKVSVPKEQFTPFL